MFRSSSDSVRGTIIRGLKHERRRILQGSTELMLNPMLTSEEIRFRLLIHGDANAKSHGTVNYGTRIGRTGKAQALARLASRKGGSGFASSTKAARSANELRRCFNQLRLGRLVRGG